MTKTKTARRRDDALRGLLAEYTEDAASTNDVSGRETSRDELVARYRETLSRVQGKLIVGRKLTREEMNER